METSLARPMNVVNNEDVTISSAPSATTSRFDLLKERIREKQERLQMDNVIMSQPLIQKPIPPVVISEEIPKIDSFVDTSDNREKDIGVGFDVNLTSDPVSKSEATHSSSVYRPLSKKYLKRTIRRKYTLGKSKLKKTVGILIKDRNTRKQVLNAQKDLKRTTIHDVKKYLRDHNLIRAGSNTPNDVVRKIYETAMLAGDVTNFNKETLLHNLIG
jgi:hypothetical protein